MINLTVSLIFVSVSAAFRAVEVIAKPRSIFSTMIESERKEEPEKLIEHTRRLYDCMRKHCRPPLYVYPDFFANLGHNSVQVKTPMNIGGESNKKRQGRLLFVCFYTTR